jgi:ribosomal protein L40E
MWVRVTCPNGHKVRIETKYLGRNNRCPKCEAHVYLWVQVLCPQGHMLKVQSKHAGKTGTCPICKSSVDVPDLTEAIALDTLAGATGPASVHDEPLGEGSSLNGSAAVGSSIKKTKNAQPKLCPACRAPNPPTAKTCAHCGRYIGDSFEFRINGPAASQAGRSVRCPECDATGFPGAEYCSCCGTRLPVG